MNFGLAKEPRTRHRTGSTGLQLTRGDPVNGLQTRYPKIKRCPSASG